MLPAQDPRLSRLAAIEIVRTLRAAGHTAYLAGGCVRDELLGLTPSDYDVATDARPDRVRSLLSDRRTFEVGASFGVVLVRDPSGALVEVATFRSDGPYSDRRRPDSVTFADADADARRRDFTVNALFLDPLDTSSSPAGRVIDFVGGVADLKARVLRAVGDPEARLAEDHLRALRAARFGARLGFAIDPRTADAVRAHASELAGVSRERVGDEVRRMFASPTRARGAVLMSELRLDGPALNEPCAACDGATLGALPPDAPLGASLAAWAIDRGIAPGSEPAVRLVPRWRDALCLSNEERDSLADILLAVADLASRWGAGTVAWKKRLASSDAFSPALMVLEGRSPPLAGAVRDEVRALAAGPGGLSPTPILDGEALIRAGLRPGPAFKRVLDGVYDAQLEGKVRSEAEAVELARRLYV